MIDFKNLPKDIQELVLKEQVLQGNKPDVNIFNKNLGATKDEGGMNWLETKGGYIGWAKAFFEEDFTIIRSKYSVEKVREPKKLLLPFVREQLNKLDNEEITMSRFVEILNEEVELIRKKK